MKHVSFVLGFVCALVTSLTEPVHGQVPDFAWANSAGGSGWDLAHGIAVDNNGNSYITGLFAGNVTFGNNTLTSNGNHDIFVAKYDAAGNVLWVKSAGGLDWDEGFGIAADSSGNCYVTGSFQGTATFGSTALTSSGSGDIFIAKYDAAGNMLWVKSAGGSNWDEGFGIAVDNIGNSYITGYYRGAGNFGSTTLSSIQGSIDAFIAKYDGAGNVLWAKGAGGEHQDEGRVIAVDTSGNCYITGEFLYNATFGSTTISSGSFGQFLAKFDASGNAQWAKQPITTNTLGLGLAVDASGNCFITGEFYGTATMGNTTLVGNSPRDIFVAKYDAGGNVLWARQAGGTQADEGTALAIDGGGNCYVTGSFQGTATFGSTTLTSSGWGDIFIAKYDTAGTILWVKKAGGTGQDLSYGLALENSGNIYVSGRFQETALFGNTILSTNYNPDIFIAKLSTITGLSENSISSIPTSPNPFTTSFQLSLSTTEPATAILTDLLGREVHRQNLTLETENAAVTISPNQNLPAGMYLLQIQQGKEIRQARVLKQ